MPSRREAVYNAEKAAGLRVAPMNPTRRRIVRNTLFLVVPAGLFLGLAALNLLSALWDSQYRLGFHISPRDRDLIVGEVSPGSPA